MSAGPTACAFRVGCCTKGRPVRGGEDDFGMAQNFLGCDREQELLLPPSLREWLPEGPRYEPPDTPAGTINLTDLDSRNLKTPRRWVQGYNAQAATTSSRS
jgi:hypothetical protein